SEAPHRHGARLVRLLRRRRKRRRYATGAGEEDEEDRAPLSRAAAVPMLDGARFCVGYDGALERSSGARAGRDVYRVDDVLGGAGGGRATRTPALRDAGGFALHDDEDDVYGGGDERFALTAFAGEDDGAGVRPGRLLAGTPALGAGGRLRDAATRRPGTLAGFSRAAAVPPPPPPAALARPPRAWRGVHAFQTPPLASPWLAARSERTGEVAADGVARRRTALEGKVPAGAFEGLARAMGSRFATASASDATRP
ncbi:unnamed protein product, partial [Pelagomonas calceolata]